MTTPCLTTDFRQALLRRRPPANQGSVVSGSTVLAGTDLTCAAPGAWEGLPAGSPPAQARARPPPRLARLVDGHGHAPHELHPRAAAAAIVTSATLELCESPASPAPRRQPLFGMPFACLSGPKLPVECQSICARRTVYPEDLIGDGIYVGYPHLVGEIAPPERNLILIGRAHPRQPRP